MPNVYTIKIKIGNVFQLDCRKCLYNIRPQTRTQFSAENIGPSSGHSQSKRTEGNLA